MNAPVKSTLGKVGQKFSETLDLAKDALRAPVDAVEVGIGGFSLFARVSESVTYGTGVPVHILEDGSSAMDHLSPQAITLTISGTVADIMLQAPVEDIISKTSAKVGTVSGFLPARTQSQIQAITDQALAVRDTVDRIGQLVDAGRNALDLFGDKTESTPIREQFVDAMEQIYYGRQLVDIEVAYRVHKNMAITGMTISRDNGREALDFTLNAVQIRVAQTEWSAVADFFQAPAPAVKAQVAKPKNAGVTDVKNAPDVNISALRKGAEAAGLIPEGAP